MISFQCISWHSGDEDYFDENENKFYVTTFGRTQDGQSIMCKTYFQPFFFIEIDNPEEKIQIESTVRNKLINRYKEVDKNGKSKWVENNENDTLISVECVHRKKFMYFTNDELFPFLKFTFKTKRAFYRVLKILSNNYQPYESNIDPMLRFCHLQNIKMAGWCLIDTDMYETLDDKTSNVDIEIYVDNYKNVIGTETETIAPIVQASFDIETYSSDGGFPDPKDDSSAVIQIATTLQICGEPEPYKKHIITLKKCNKIDGVEVEWYNNEKDVLVAWKNLIKREKVDILIGYNIWGFDLWYMYTRAQKVKANNFFYLSKIDNKESECITKQFTSGAYGASDYKMVDTLGILQIDLLVIMKREHKLESYSLNNVSKHFLKDNKVDMPYKLMFQKFAKGTPQDITEIAEYCVKDTDLPLQLMNKLAILPNMIEMSKATWVPMNFLVERGQGIKVFSQILYTTLHENMLVISNLKAKEDLPDTESESKGYVGATVLTALKGPYMKDPITGLDFASLYPTIMRAHNLCHSTLVNDIKYENIPGIKYDEIEGFKFAQNNEGILPKMLRVLAENRKKAKKDMKNAPNSFMKAVYNGKQLAFKVSMNSIYGFCGASQGFLPCKPVAACTTSKGRDMIEHTKNLVEKWYPGSTVVYGDSVTADTSLLIKENNKIKTSRIDSLVNEYKTRNDGKEFSFVNCEVWTEKGFTKINQVIRHKTTKNMYRIVTHTGIVDVTEDHSLLLEDTTQITPNDVQIGTKLLHGNCKNAFTSEYDNSLTIEEAKVMGFFYGDGSCGKYGSKYTWALNNSNIDYLLLMQYLCPFETSLLDTLKSSGVYKLNAIGNIKSITLKYRQLFYNKFNEKIVPSCILNNSLEILQAFWDGYYMADGDKDINNYTRCDNKGKEGSLGLYIIGVRLGYNVSINTRTDKQNIFRLTFTKNLQRKNKSEIKKIIYLGTITDYVYDLSTDHGHFHVGPGELVVHNTDSVMVKFKTDTDNTNDAIKKSFDLGNEAADRISDTFRKPIELEMEKVYCPYLLFSKKRYAGLMYTDPEKPDYIDAKGIQLVRRDNCPFVKEVSTNVLNTIMYEQDLQKAIQIAKDGATSILKNEVPIDKLIVSKSMKRIEYKEYKGLPVYYNKEGNLIPNDKLFATPFKLYYNKENNIIPKDLLEKLDKSKLKVEQNVFIGKDKKPVDKQPKSIFSLPLFRYCMEHEYLTANQPHLTVALKREERDPGTGPKSGDRVPYVFIDTKNSRDLQYQKAEDPEYVKQNDLKIDLEYYIHHGLKSPLASLFELFIENPEKELFEEALQNFKSKRNNYNDIYKILGIEL